MRTLGFRRLSLTAQPALETMPDNNDRPSLFAFAVELLKRGIFGVQEYSLLAVRSVYNVLTPPVYWADTLEQMDSIGVGSLPIIIAAFLSIGGVLVLQTAAQFQRFGETALTGEAVALALVRELGPAIAALLVAGRNASGIASELGSMVVTEQVDAMRALGTDPTRKLVTPRVVAMVLVLPLLVAVADLVGLAGGFIVAHFTLRLGAVEFWTQAIDSLEFGDLVQGTVKPIIFGFIISTIACHKGLGVTGGTQGVGRATTSSVVASSLWMLIIDLFLAKLLLFIFQK